MSEDRRREEEFLERHLPLTDEQLKKQMEDTEEARIKHDEEMAIIEDNLVNYFQQTDPLVDRDTNKVLAIVRRPSQKEIETLMLVPEMPPETELNKMSDDERMKVANRIVHSIRNQYEVIAELIIKPRHDAEWWVKNAPPQFLSLVNQHIQDKMEEMAGKAANFRERRRGRR